jgi:hypothetical protein
MRSTCEHRPSCRSHRPRRRGHRSVVANEARTQGAPQQAVVNGWITKDLLTIIAEQQNDALSREELPTPLTPMVPNDERIPALVGLLVVGLALALFTAPRPPRTAEQARPTEFRGDALTTTAP